MLNLLPADFKLILLKKKFQIIIIMCKLLPLFILASWLRTYNGWLRSRSGMIPYLGASIGAVLASGQNLLMILNNYCIEYSFFKYQIKMQFLFYFISIFIIRCYKINVLTTI